MSLIKEKDSPSVRFSNVLKILKNKGFSQRVILDNIDLEFVKDETYFSSLKSGKRKSIPDKLINALHEKYKINPAYLKMESDCIFDTIEIRLEHFMNFIEDWNVLIGEKNKYLHLTIDQNIIDLLMDLCNVKRIISEEGISSFEREKEALIEIYTAEPDPKEYVLIPRNSFIEIVQDSVKNERYIQEILDFTKYSDYPYENEPLNEI